MAKTADQKELQHGLERMLDLLKEYTEKMVILEADINACYLNMHLNSSIKQHYQGIASSLRAKHNNLVRVVPEIARLASANYENIDMDINLRVEFRVRLNEFEAAPKTLTGAMSRLARYIN